MSDEQWRAIVWGAFGFLIPQIIIWLSFAIYLLATGRLHG